MESVQAIKKLHPINHGKVNALLDGGEQSSGKFNQLALSDPELDSDEEAELKKSFFEQMVYWQFE